MGNSLRDQLLKAGLVDEKQARKAVREKQKESFRQQGQGRMASPDEEKLRVQRAQAEKIQRDRELNLQRQEQAEKKAILAQIRQLVEQNLLPKEEGDSPYNFLDGKTVKRLYISDKLRRGIAQGQVAIVRLEQQYELVPRETAEKIRVRDRDAVILLNDPSSQTAAESSPDDPYEKFSVPDDLFW